MDYLVYQINKKACALAATQMLLINELRSRKYLYFRLNNHPPNTLLDLEESVKKYGYKLFFYKGDNKQIDYPKDKKRGFLAVTNIDNYLHMVYVKKITSKYVYYLDPAIGKRKEKKDKFIETYSGIFGILEIKEKLNIKGEKIMISKLKLFLLYLTSLGSTASILTAFYFFNEHESMLLPLIFFISFAFFLIMNRYLGVHLNYSFDKKYLNKLHYNEENVLNIYEQYQIYKKYHLSIFPNALNALTSAIALLILVSLNNIYFLLPTSISISLYLILRKIMNNQLEKRKNEIEQLEKKISSSKNQNEFNETLFTLTKLSSSFALKIEYKRIIVFFIIITTNLLSMLGSKEITLNFYLFHLFSLSAIFLLSEQFINVITSRKEYKISRGNVIEYFN